MSVVMALLLRSFVALGLLTALLLVEVAVFADPVDDVEQLLRQGEIEDALQQVETLLTTDPTNARVRFLKGLALAENEQLNEAIKVFLSLTIDYPKAPQAYSNLAVIYARMERYEEAIQMLQRALRVDPDYAEAYENLGDIYVTLAGIVYAGALALDDENVAARDKLGALEKLVAINETYERRNGKAKTADSVPEDSSLVAAPTARPARNLGNAKSLDAVSGIAAEERAWAIAATKPPPADGDAGSTESIGPESAMAAEINVQIEQMLHAWAAAWSRQDVDAYLRYYDDHFAPASGMDRETWEGQRRQRLSHAKTISVELQTIDVERRGADNARATFIQRYRSESYSDEVRKMLMLKKQAGQWRIVRELTLSSSSSSGVGDK